MEKEQYYPTPNLLARKLFNKLKLVYIESILEPSAGEGNLADVFIEVLNTRKNRYGSYQYKPNSLDIDCIEINSNRRHVLKGKGYRVVEKDFLEYETWKQYNLILMNPPFRDGDKHLLKAIKMQQEHGGQIACILNAETLRTLHSNVRKELDQLLTEYKAEIEFVEEAFVHAERTTFVEVALIAVNIPAVQVESFTLDKLRKSNNVKYEQLCLDDMGRVVSADPWQALIERYNLEIKIGVSMFREMKALGEHLLVNPAKGSTAKLLSL